MEIMKISENSNQSANSRESKKKKIRNSRDEMTEKDTENTCVERFKQNIVKSFQPLSISKKKRRSGNPNSETEVFEVESPGGSQSEEFSPNPLKKRLKTNSKKKRRISFVADTESDSNRSYDVTENEDPNYRNHVKPNHNEDGKKSKPKAKRRSSRDTFFTDFLSPTKRKHADDDMEFGDIIKSEKLLANSASSRGSENVPIVENFKTESDVLRKEKNRRKRIRVGKNKSNTLTAIIYGSPSSSDDETKEISVFNTSEKTMNKGNLVNIDESRFSEILISDTDQESHASKPKHARDSISLSNCGKTSKDYRSETHKNGRKRSKENRRGFQLAERITSEKTESDVFRKVKNHKAKEKVREKKTNKFLAMINDSRSSSESDDENQKINDSSEETSNERNLTKHNRSRVSKTLLTDDEEEGHFSNIKHLDYFISPSNRDKTSEDYRAEGQENDQNFSQDNEQSFELAETMKSDTLSSNAASDCGSSNISVEAIKIEPDVLRKDRKHKAKEKIKKKEFNTLLAMIRENRSSSESNDETKQIDDSSVESWNLRKHNKSRDSKTLLSSDEEKEGRFSNMKRLEYFDSLSKGDKTSEDYPSKSPENDQNCSQDNEQSFQLAKRKKSETLSANAASDCGSRSISVEAIKIEPDVLRKDRKHKAKEKIKKKKSNALLAMIRENRSSSESNDETKQIDDSSEESWNLGKHNKSRVSKTLLSSDEEEEGPSSNMEHFEYCDSLSNGDKTSEDYRSKSPENDQNCSQDNEQSFQLAKRIKSESLSANAASDCGSRNISVEAIKIEPDVLRKERKHKAKEKIKKRKFNTLLAMIRENRSSSESNDETKQIDDSSEESWNLKKHNKSRVSKTLLSSDKEEEGPSSNMEHFEYCDSLSNGDKTSEDYRSKSPENYQNCSQDNRQSFELVETTKSETLSANAASDCDSPNISVKAVKVEPDVLRKDRKHKAKEKIKKKKSNALLAMIRENRSSSESNDETELNDETKQIDDSSEESWNLRKHNKSRVSKTLLSSDEEEEGRSSNMERLEYFDSLSNGDKTSEDYRSKSPENDQNCSQDNEQSFQLAKRINSETLSANAALDCSSRNILVEAIKIVPDVLSKDRKHKAKEKIKKKKSNTLLEMIRENRSSSESNDESKQIDDSSEESWNLRKHNKSRVSKTLLSSDKEEEGPPSNMEHFEYCDSLSNGDKTSEDYRSKSPDNDQNCSQDDRQSFELVETMKSETLSANAASDCDSPNISVKAVKIEPDVLRKDRKQRQKHKAKEKIKKKKSNALLAMIRENRSSSESNDETEQIDDSSEESRNLRKHNKSRVSKTLLSSDEEEEGRSSNMERLEYFDSLSNGDKTSEDYRSKSPENSQNCSQDNEQSFQLAKRIKSETLSANTASNCDSPNISVKAVKIEPDVLKKDRKHKAKEKIKKSKFNTLLAMIRENRSSSESNDETKQIDDSSEEARNLRKHNKSTVSKTLLSSDEEEEGPSSNMERLEYCDSTSNGDKTSEDYRSKSPENDQNCSRDNKQSFELVETIKSEILSANAASDYGSPNISVKAVKIEPDVLQKDRKHKAKEKIKKKKSNALLEMIRENRSSSESNDETKQIDDSSNSRKSLNKVNLRKSTRSGAKQTFATSNKEEEDPTSSMELLKNPSAKSRKFDLEVEAKDLEELIIAAEEEEQVPEETLKKLHSLRITLKNAVPPQHQIETCAGSRGPTAQQKELIEKFGPIKYGKFTPEEDDIIVQNWKSFCKLHDWDPRDVQPFLYMRHQQAGLITKFSERQKFVQFLASGLPWRLLYSVYWRFRNLYQPHIQTRYTEDEDKLILAHMENSSSIQTRNVRKFSELAKVLNRTRASVWRRYRLLNKKRNPHRKIEWNVHLVKKLIKNLMKSTMSEDVNQLKDLHIPSIVWKKLAKKFELDETDLKLFWQGKLHMQLFCKEPVYLNDVKIKLIEYFYTTGVTERWEIEWANVAKHFDGMTSMFLSKIFDGLVHDKIFEDMEFSEIVEYLYEVKKPRLQRAPNDKCLPRVVFKNGNVKLLDVEAKKRRR